MKAIKYLIFSLFMLTFSTNNLWGIIKEEKVNIQKDTTYYNVGEIPILEFSYIIKNTTSQPVWIWLSQKNISQCSDSLKTRNYFRKIKGNWSFYQLAMDGNVEDFKPTLFFSFIKVLQPDDTFVIQIIAENYLSRKGKQSDNWLKIKEKENQQQNQLIKQIITTLDKHIVILPQKKIIGQIPGMENETVKNQFYFKPKSITLNWNLFHSQLEQ